jgi:uncharacterized protein DUF4349
MTGRGRGSNVATPMRKPLLIAALLLVACNVRDEAKQAAAGAGSSSSPATEQAESTPAAKPVATVTTKPDEATKGLAEDGAEEDRKIIRTGRIELVVATYDDARVKVDALVASVGGYVDSTRVDRRQGSVSDATIVVRIPSSKFGGLLPKLREIGEVVSESTDAADITDQYVDIAARLAGAQALEKRLLELATAKEGKIDQILAVERELARVRTEVETYQGKIRQWDNQVTLSTLTLQLSTKRPEIVAAPKPTPTLGSQTKQSFSDSFAALRDFGTWLAVTAIAIVPWLILIIPGLVIGRRLGRRLLRRLPRAVVQPPVAQPGPAPQA